MSLQHLGHLIVGVAALAATLAISSLTVNRLVKRKLKLSVFLLGAYVVLHVGLALWRTLAPETDAELLSFERLAFAAGLINLLVIAFINPLRADRVPDRFPTILQDFIVIGILLVVATFVWHDTLLTTSAVSAVVIGFALQDTLGNAFAGLAIQSEKPFNVGHWIRVGDFEGRVAEVTWRATKLRTKTGNFVIVPNNIVSKEAITNYSEPAAPTQIDVEVGASYQAGPNAVKAALEEALANAPGVLKAPAPDVMLVRFDASSIAYRVRFWIEDYERDEAARDQVRTAIYYAFGRHGIDIPYPIQAQFEMPVAGPDPAARQSEREQWLAGVDLFATLTGEHRREIAESSATRIYGNGEAIVRQGQPGESMFVVGIGPRGRGAGARSPRGRDDRARRLLRRDVAADRRAADRDRRRARRHRGARDRRRPLPAARRGEPASGRADRCRGRHPPHGARSNPQRVNGNGRRRRAGVVRCADEEISTVLEGHETARAF